MSENYGVPTGYVPRAHTLGAYPPGAPTWTCLAEGCGKVHYSAADYNACKESHVMREEAIQQAVDDYILMERKARAWDALEHVLRQAPAQITPDEVLRRMRNLVHPAPAGSTR